MAKTIESKVADTILQKPQTVKVGSHVYEVAPPSAATLIEVSAVISKLPIIEGKDVLKVVLHSAKDCEPVGEIVATMIVGAKGLRGWWLKRLLKMRKVRRVARRVLDEVPPAELQAITLTLLNNMQVGDFFGLTAFLSEINMTKATKAETETTASGQQ